MQAVVPVVLRACQISPIKNFPQDTSAAAAPGTDRACTYRVARPRGARVGIGEEIVLRYIHS